LVGSTGRSCPLQEGAPPPNEQREPIFIVTRASCTACLAHGCGKGGRAGAWQHSSFAGCAYGSTQPATQHAASKPGRSTPAVQLALVEAVFDNRNTATGSGQDLTSDKNALPQLGRVPHGQHKQPQTHGTALSSERSGAERGAPRQPWARRGILERPNCETPPTPPAHAALLPARAHRPRRAPAPWR